MILHDEARAVITLIEEWYRSQSAPPRKDQTINQARVLMKRLAPLRWSGQAKIMASVNDVMLEARSGLHRARVYRPEKEFQPFTLIYVHGGGYVVGGIDEFDPECRRFASSLGCNVVALSYRLAPEHPWPAAVDDVEDAVLQVSRQAIPNLKGPIVLAGASAGAGLAVAVCRRLVKKSACPVRLLVLLSPWLDMTLTQPSTQLYATGHQLDLEMLTGFCKQYIPDTITKHHPELSPARNPIPNPWPETVLFAAECDPLADDTALFARRLCEANVPHHIRYARGMPHGCHGWWDHIPALNSDIEWLDKTIIQHAVS